MGDSVKKMKHFIHIAEYEGLLRSERRNPKLWTRSGVYLSTGCNSR
jgi:hypothetical protein